MSSHLDVALELADIADVITLARFRAPDLRVDTKSDHTPVTDADRATEQALRDALQRLRPEQAIVGEEFGGDGQADWRWILDPIDGTINYANGVPVWATLIALMRARVVRAFGDFWSHMLVAEGVIDVAIEAWVNPWDVAAAQVILKEAGGRFSDFDGADRIDSGNVITTNGLLHEELVTLMADPSRVATRD
jgi:fructose-1,6-bisphosphatase/inositol monophosphatase family enzyme